MAKKTKEEAKKTRERILDAAEFVFAERGVSGAAVSHIAARAKFSRGALYGHYKDKIDICLAMCRRGYARSAVPPSFHQQPRALDSLYLIVAHYMRQRYEPCSMQRILHILYFKCEDLAENAPLFFYRDAMEKIQRREIWRVLQRAISQKEVSPDLDMPLVYAYLDTLASGIHNTCVRSCPPGRNFWPTVARMLHTGIEGLRTSLFLSSPCPPMLQLAGGAIRANVDPMAHPALRFDGEAPPALAAGA